MVYDRSHIRADNKQNRSPPVCLRGFEHISRYWDKENKIFTAKILPGEFYVSVKNELITTVLGSCIAACIRDVTLGIGGMNHFMLPMGCEIEHSGKKHLTTATRYGNFAMEILINEIIKAGGKKSNLQVKLFGGARVLSSMKTMDIGLKNINFVHEYLQQEGMTVVAEDIGGDVPRKILFYPETGRVRMKKLQAIHNDTVIKREENYRKRIDKKPVQSEVELF